MRRILLSFLLALAVAGPGITDIPVAEAAGTTVTFTDRAEPATLTVAPGARVTFANQSGTRRRVRSDDGPVEFDSGNLEAGGSWSVVLDVAGTYPYVDDRDRDDPAYHGTITVSAAPPPAGGSPVAPGSPSAPSGSPAPPAPATASVAVLDRSFSPGSVTVAAGGTVSWTNQSDREHTVTGSGFDSGVFGGGGRFSHTFPSAGTFAYICDLHPEMRGSVTVTGGPGGAQPSPTPPVTASPAPAAPAPRPTTPKPPAPAPATTAPAAVRHDVSVVDYAFRPATLAARVGDSVVWTNDGRAPHTATAVGVFDTGLFRANEQRTTTLRTAGTFTFRCTVHPEMTGVLTVAPAPDRAAPAGSPGAVPPSPSPAAAGGPTTTTVPAPPAQDPAAATAEVSVVDFAFDPGTVRVDAGGTVTWRQTGAAPHTVSAVDASFDSGLLETGGTFSHRFDRPGSYEYVCALHPDMVGTVEVVDGVSGAAAGAGDATEQAAAPLRAAAVGSTRSAGAWLAALLGAAGLLAGAGALLYGGSRMMAAADRP